MSSASPYPGRRICRDRHSVRSCQGDDAYISAPQTKLRPHLAHGRGLAKLSPERHTSTHPQNSNLAPWRLRPRPSQTQKLAEGPLFRPSLALNLDPAPVHPSVTHNTPSTRCPSSRPRPLYLPLIQPGSPASLAGPRPLYICCSHRLLSLHLRQPGRLSVTHQHTHPSLDLIQSGRRALSRTG